MAHQVELEKAKYRNWVRGGLAYKYLKQGIEGFTDDLVLQEHKRILQNIKHTPGQPCTQCRIGSLKPKHASACPRGQINCSCQDRKKKSCPNQVCDAIMGDILDSHGSQPYWQKSDIQKWCSDPWEVAKCFINAPGYADKTSASDIDAAGLLHVFINNTKLHSHLSCAISRNGTDVFSKVRKRRNQIFHSSTMEMDHNDLNDCIADITTLLEDAKELKQRPEAKAAVEKLRELNQNSFVITTYNEVEVCRDAVVSVANISEELKQAMNERLKHVETENATLKKDISLIKQQLCNPEEQDTSRNKHKKQLEYEEKKEALQRSLVERYEKGGYFNTWISPLKTQQNNIAVNEIYVTPNMVLENKDDELSSTRHSSPGSKTPSHVESKLKRVDGYPDIFQTDEARHKKIYIIGDVGTGKSTLSKMMIFDWCKAIRGESNKTESTDQKCTECHSEVNKTVVLSDEDGKNKGKSEQDNPNDSNETSDISPSLEDEQISTVNIREMNKFDFLFTIPLQGMSGFTNVIEMLKALYNPTKDVKTDELITEIFNQESERCLVIADGLDEWTPPKDSASPQHVSYGIPVRDGVNNATLVTLSRPSAKGILNMDLTEYDQKIKLIGVHTTSVNDFVTKYMEINGKKDKKDDFMEKISQTKLEHLEKTPLILQQLVWMYCTHDNIGKSVADIYSNIVNIIFGWFENKGEDIAKPSVNIDGECENMQLPDFLRRFPRCEQNKRILLPLGKLAFKACIEDRVSTFGRYGCGLSKDDIDTLIRFGILVEHNCHDPTIQKSSLSFIHISYLEFFAAVYISGSYFKQSPTPKKERQLQSRTMLNELFMKMKTAKDILQLSNILKMVCGLSPFLLEEISNLISKQMMSDESTIKYRNEFSDRSIFFEREVELIQNLISSCLLECGTEKKLAVRLSDVRLYLTNESEKQILENIVSDSVVSLYVNHYMYLTNKANYKEIIKLLPMFHRLQFIHVHGFKSCEMCKLLSSILSQATLLKNLTLAYILCDQNVCKGHNIDLSKHDELQSINIKHCSFILQSMVSAKSLERISISHGYFHKTPHGTCELLASSLTQAVSLKQLTLKNIHCHLDDCEGHSFDLSKHDELRSIEIKDCLCMLGSVVHAKCVESIYISVRNDNKTRHMMLEPFSPPLIQARSINQLIQKAISCDREIIFISARYHKIPHGICEHLSSSLTQAVSLKQLTLKNIHCHLDDCEGHSFDLSKHDELVSIEIDDCSCQLGSVIYTKSLESISISQRYTRKTPHGICEHLSSSLTQTVFLEKLTLKNIRCDRDDCKGHAIDLSKHDRLNSIQIEDCPSLLGYMRITKSQKRLSISENSNRRTPHAVCEYLSSSLSQAVSMKQLKLSNITCDRDTCDDHTIDLSKHDELQSIHLHNCSFTFGSVVNTKILQEVDIWKISTRSTLGMFQHLTSSLSLSVYLECFTLGARPISNRSDQLERLWFNLFSYLDLTRFHRNHVRNLRQLSCTNNLHTLKLEVITQYTSKLNNVVQTLQQLKILELNHIGIDENALTVTSGMLNLNYIGLDYVSMSLQTWRSFVDSLLELQHSVHVNTLSLDIGHGQIDVARQYVTSDETLFKVHSDIWSDFAFSSKKTHLEN